MKDENSIEFFSNLRQLAYRFTRKYIKQFGRDPTEDEYSESFVRLCESAKNFNPEKYKNFESFAHGVVFRGMPRYFKVESKKKRYEPLGKEQDHSEILSDADQVKRNMDLKDEMTRFITLMEKHNYSIKSLKDAQEMQTRYSYTTKELYQLAGEIVNAGMGDAFLKGVVTTRDLNRLLGRKVKIKESHRPLLCAMIIVLVYDMPIMRNFLKINCERGCKGEKGGKTNS